MALSTKSKWARQADAAVARRKAVNTRPSAPWGAPAWLYESPEPDLVILSRKIEGWILFIQEWIVFIAEQCKQAVCKPLRRDNPEED